MTAPVGPPPSAAPDGGAGARAADVQVLPVPGLPEVVPGTDLAALISAAAPWLVDGDVLVVTSKIVSKAEGRLVPVGDDREAAREAAIDGETTAVVATRGRTRIVRTPQGLVLASAGVDTSNVGQDVVALLPEDSDASARALRAGLRDALGVDVAVIVSDTMGRPWRVGVADVAIGAAGLRPLRDLRGQTDNHGNDLAMTVVADADQIAAAAELVKGKSGGVPVAVVRGVRSLVDVGGDDGSGAAALVRALEEDMFALGTAEARELGRREALTLRRSIRVFRSDPVPADAIARAVAAAVTAPAPHHTTPWRFVHVASDDVRKRLLAGMREAWAADLRGDGFDEAAIGRRLKRGDLLWEAPALVVPVLALDGAHPYPDARRAASERAMFQVAMGAGVQNFLVALATEGIGSCWVSSTMFAADLVRSELDLPDDWHPMGSVAIGYPAEPPRDRPARDASAFFLTR
ncbi:coenzyme F420-0:L-glutamate ligase [Cryptosporangium japonicum]|uniref:Coenzyme F420-0:L-glutamate ligase n=1 Tax=Cryptosporangium japonicum TaxID=80872 RepID=A0ABP3EMZ7_9ACTN